MLKASFLTFQFMTVVKKKNLFSLKSFDDCCVAHLD